MLEQELAKVSDFFTAQENELEVRCLGPAGTRSLQKLLFLFLSFSFSASFSPSSLDAQAQHCTGSLHDAWQASAAASEVNLSLSDPVHGIARHREGLTLAALSTSAVLCA